MKKYIILKGEQNKINEYIELINKTNIECKVYDDSIKLMVNDKLDNWMSKGNKITETITNKLCDQMPLYMNKVLD